MSDLLTLNSKSELLQERSKSHKNIPTWKDRCIGHVYYVALHNFNFKKGDLPSDWLEQLVEHPKMHFNDVFIKFAMKRPVYKHLITTNQCSTTESIQRCTEELTRDCSENATTMYNYRIVSRAMQSIAEKRTIERCNFIADFLYN
jgi:hypothetical protein